MYFSWGEKLKEQGDFVGRYLISMSSLIVANPEIIS